jgi:hypothetical protein
MREMRAGVGSGVRLLQTTSSSSGQSPESVLFSSPVSRLPVSFARVLVVCSAGA